MQCRRFSVTSVSFFVTFVKTFVSFAVKKESMVSAENRYQTEFHARFFSQISYCPDKMTAAFSKITKNRPAPKRPRFLFLSLICRSEIPYNKIGMIMQHIQD